MSQVVQVPVKTFPDGTKWLLLSHVMGKKIRLRAHKIIKNKKKIQDYDDHHIGQVVAEEASAKYSIKCASAHIDIYDKIMTI